MLILSILLSFCAVDVLGAALDDVYKKLGEVQGVSGQLNARVDKLWDENTIMEKSLEDALIEGPIAFSVAKNTTQSVTSGDIIKFEHKFIDTHSLFNVDLGIFTVPQTGIYEFKLTLYKSSSSTYSNGFGDLYVGNTFLTRMRLYYGTDTTASDHSTSTVIREFNIGDTVYVRAANTVPIYGSASFLASQFSGKYIGPMPAK